MPILQMNKLRPGEVVTCPGHIVSSATRTGTKSTVSYHAAMAPGPWIKEERHHSRTEATGGFLAHKFNHLPCSLGEGGV